MPRSTDELGRWAACGALARDLLTRRSARIEFALRRGEPDGSGFRMPGVDLGTIGIADFVTREVVGHGPNYGGQSVYIGGVWYTRDSSRERFTGHRVSRTERLPLGHPLWILFALTAGGHEVENRGTTTLRDTSAERFALSLKRTDIRAEAASQRIDDLESLASPEDVPVEIWLSPDGDVLRLAYTDPPLKHPPQPHGASTLWHCTDLWDFGVPPLEVPCELRTDPPTADFGADTEEE